MDRSYGLPIALAAALHGALFFGFGSTPSPAKPPPQVDKPRPSDFIAVKPEEPPPIELAGEAAAEKSAPEVLQPPVSQEPVSLPVPDDDSPKITPPPINPDIKRSDTLNLNQLAPSGVVGGDGDKPNWSNIVGTGLLDKTPNTRLQVNPIYPFEAKKSGLQGEVVVEFIVDEAGTVIDARAVRSTDRVFEEPSVRAVMKWKFEPGKRDGRVVRFRMALPLVFKLDE